MHHTGLILGAVAERMKFSAVLLFMALWVTLIYFPMAHMVWYWGGPDAFGNAAKALAAATGEGKVAAQAAMDAVLGRCRHDLQVGCSRLRRRHRRSHQRRYRGPRRRLILGKRVGYGKEHMPPHSLTMCMIGAALLWFGWFGFNVGSNLEANAFAGQVIINTFVATAAAALSWMIVEWMAKGKPSALGLVSGVVAGLVAITPACGFVGVMGSIALGLIVSPICFVFCLGDQERASATTTALTCSASTASAASSALSQPASLSIRASVARASRTTSRSRANWRLAPTT